MPIFEYVGPNGVQRVNGGIAKKGERFVLSFAPNSNFVLIEDEEKLPQGEESPQGEPLLEELSIENDEEA